MPRPDIALNEVPGLANCMTFCHACPGDNEIDDVLLRLLQQNIDAARMAGQEQPAQYMEKLRDAAKRFTLKI